MILCYFRYFITVYCLSLRTYDFNTILLLQFTKIAVVHINCFSNNGFLYVLYRVSNIFFRKTFVICIIFDLVNVLKPALIVEVN